MSEQLDLVEALERVKLPERNLYRECLIAAYDWLDQQAEGFEFTAGQLAEGAWEFMRADPVEPRVWGAVMREIARQRRITATGKLSTWGRSHGGVARVWRVEYRR